MNLKKILNALLISVPLVFVMTALAQDDGKFDISAGYSYFRFNPTITGVQSRSLNGGGGAIQLNLLKFLGIKADLQGYGSTSFTATYGTPIVTPKGTIPPGTYTTNGNQFTWLFGPVVQIPTSKVKVFGELLFGGSNTNAYANLSRSIDAGGGTIPLSGTQHPFTMALGGGVDVNVSKRIALRLGEFDYILTRYTNPLTNTNNQNNFRYLAGVVFKLGGE